MRCSGQAPGSETDEAREGERKEAGSAGGRCQKGAITWRHTDSIVHPELQLPAHRAVMGLS